MIENIMTFDVEEWFDAQQRRAGSGKFCRESRVRIGVDKILSALYKGGVKATFFVLGSVAEKDPQVIKDISADGHEIATHGYTHRSISEQTPVEFENDLLRSIDALKGVTGKQVSGFRAPGYSITTRTLWALDIIEKAGLKYDSSIYPVSIRLFTKGGASGYQQHPFYIKKNLVEFPLVTLDVFGIKIPAATTAYFRIYPYSISGIAINRLNNIGIPATVNFHSWEFDEFHPRLPLPFPYNIKHYYNLEKIRDRFNRLITEFKFGGCMDQLALAIPWAIK